jgi:hypothetical protein
MKKLFVSLSVTAISCAALAKLPVPVLDDAAKAKAAEAAAKTAWSGKLEGFLLCKYQDKAAANYVKTATSSGKTPKLAAVLPPCADPGPFVYVPGGAAVAAVPAPAVPTAAAPAPAAAPVAPAKKS